MNKSKFQTVESINLIRIAGMLLVLLFHNMIHYRFCVSNVYLNELISIGAIGVTIFFMISGFGLRMSQARLSLEDKKSILTYYKKRISSIYPIWLFMILVAIIFQYRLGATWQETLSIMPIQLSMLEVLFNPTMHGYMFNDNCWYLSALFVLYLLFPFLNHLINFIDTTIKRCIVIIILSVVSFYIYYLSIYVCIQNPFLQYYVNPLYRIPEFCIGMLVADVSKDEYLMRKFKGGYKIIVFSIMFILAMHMLYPHFANLYNLYNIIVVPYISVLILCFINSERLNKVGSVKSVKYIAQLGLEMYLCQSFSIMTLQRFDIIMNKRVGFLLFTIGYAILLNTFFVRPIKKLLKNKGIKNNE